MKYALEVQALGFAYDKAPILDNVSFAVREGDFVSIIGPNGAGKSTLIKCLNKVITGWLGDITLYGSPVRRLSQRKLAKVVGYVPQPEGRSLPFTVEEFVMMGRYPYLSPFTFVSRRDRAIVGDFLCQTGIEHLAERHMDTLSGGEKQIAFITAALVQGARMILLDEPTAFLDYKHQVECLSILRRMNQEYGVTIISVTHDINVALSMTNRVLALRSGHLCFNGDPGELLFNARLESIYGARFAVYTSENSNSPVLMPCGGVY